MTEALENLRGHARFYTHKAVKALREAGFDDLQAEAVTEQISTAIGENLVTKDDPGNKG